MSTDREGPSSVLSAAPAHVAPVDSAITGLSRARPTRASPWLIEGSRAIVRGREVEDAASVEFPGLGRVGWREDGGRRRAANLLLFPGLVRRDFVGASGASVETVVVAPGLPLVVRQSARRGPGDSPEELVVDLGLITATPRQEPLHTEHGPRGVVLRAGNRCLAVALAQDVPGASISAPVVDGDLVTVRITPGEDASLLVAGGSIQDVRSALRAAGHLRGHALRAASDLAEDGVRLRTGVAEIDEGWSWLRRRLAGHIDRGEGDALLTALAVQAAGDRERGLAAAVVARIRDTPTEALLAARQALVFGDVAAAARLGAAWAHEDRVGTPGALAAVAAEQLADALRYAATPETIAALRRLGSGPDRPREARSARPTRTLPMIGDGDRRAERAGPGAVRASPDGDHIATTLSALLRGEPGGPGARPESGTVLPQWDGLARRLRAAPDAAWVEWRTALSSGLEEGPFGLATWEPTTTAGLILAMTHGLLGIAFDAPVGRLRIAPRMPEHLTRFALDGITLGDATLGFAYERDGSRRTFRLTPDMAATPPLIVLEPTVPSGPIEVFVDGARADLEVRGTGTSTVVPVQFPLDGPRELVVITLT